MKARAEVGSEEEGPLCDPGSELLLGRSARVAREDNKWDEEKKCCKGTLLLPVNNMLVSRNTHGTVSSRHGRDTPDTMN